MIPAGFKPNLAATLTKPELIRFPVYASPKIDGIRCMFFGGVAYSRSLKPIPNSDIQVFAEAFGSLLEGFDGELVVGSPTDPNCMQNSMAVMRKSGETDFTFYVFDKVGCENAIYEARQASLERVVEDLCDRYPEIDVRPVPQVKARCLADLDVLEAQYLNDGYEGMMIRSPDSLYKFGRSTEREGGLVKVKRFSDAEAEVIGFEEEMHNSNESKTNSLGRTERSSVASGLVGKDTLGALRCRNAEGHEFNIGTGFTADLRRVLWRARDSLIGTLVTYKFFDHGIKEAPRHPVFKSFRSTEDI